MSGERIKAFFTSRRFVVGLIIFLILAIGATALILFFTRPDYMSIRALAQNDIEQRSVEDYKGSRLWLHQNGTFSFEIIYRGENEFVGIGTYKKSGSTYIFTYHDMYRVMTTGSGKLQRDYENINKEYTYNISKNRIELRDPNNRIYYFK